MTHHPARPRYLTAALLSFALAIALLLAVLAASVHAAPASYSCRWTEYIGTTPRTAKIVCTNGYSRLYQWSDRYGRWVPVRTVPAGR